MRTLPILSLQLEDMSYRIRTVLDERNEELKAMVTKAMDNAIPALQQQLDGMVYSAALAALGDVVKDSAEEAVEKLSEQVSASMTAAIEQAIRKRFKV